MHLTLNRSHDFHTEPVHTTRSPCAFISCPAVRIEMTCKQQTGWMASLTATMCRPAVYFLLNLKAHQLQTKVAARHIHRVLAQLVAGGRTCEQF